MNKVRLLQTSLEVSELCLGSVNFGNPIDDDTAFSVLDVFNDYGGNFIDTAHVYANWLPGTVNRSEKTLGKWLRARKREKYVISTKGGHFDIDKPDISRVVPQEIRKDLEESLNCLKTDYIDIYFLHRDNTSLPVEEIMDCLFQLQDQGKIRYIGCSNWTIERVMEANRYAEHMSRDGFVVNQVMWSMAKVNKDSIPKDYAVMDDMTMRYLTEKNMSAMCYTALAKGYFTKLKKGLPLTQNVINCYKNEYNDSLYLERLQHMTPEDITRETLLFFRNQPVPTIPIVSCNSIKQVEECALAY